MICFEAYTIRPLATLACMGGVVTAAELSAVRLLLSTIFASELIIPSVSWMIVRSMAANIVLGTTIPLGRKGYD